MTQTLAVRRRADAGIRRSPKAGYTLIEMLVVLTIISLIVGLVGPRVLGYLGDSRVKTAKLQIESFGSALDLFYMDAGRYPTSSEGLDALAQRPTNVENWNGPYLKGRGCRSILGPCVSLARDHRSSSAL
jgi:general secretion pathway protein G